MDGLTSVEFVRGEIRLVINIVPARRCPSCGEAYVEQEVAARLLQIAEAMAAAGEMEGEVEYDRHIQFLDFPNLK